MPNDFERYTNTRAAIVYIRDMWAREYRSLCQEARKWPHDNRADGKAVQLGACVDELERLLAVTK